MQSFSVVLYLYDYGKNSAALYNMQWWDEGCGVPCKNKRLPRSATQLQASPAKTSSSATFSSSQQTWFCKQWETGLCKLPGWGKSSKLCLLSPLIGWLLAGQPIRELETARDTWAPPELKVSQEKMKFVFPMGRWVPVHGWFELQSPRSALPSQDCGQNMRCSNNSDFTGKWWQNLGLHWQCMMQSLIKRLSFVCQVSDHENHQHSPVTLHCLTNNFCISD